MGYLRQQERVGQLLTIQMDTHQLLIGSSQFFMTLDPSVYSYGETSRIQFLWEQCHAHGVKIHIKNQWREKITRRHDVFIMDEMVKRVTNPTTLRRMNDIRLYLRVSKLSDITNPAGTKHCMEFQA